MLIIFSGKIIDHHHPMYYQWLNFIIAFQAITFYLAKSILDFYDNGDITKMIKGKYYIKGGIMCKCFGSISVWET